jgi:hypothetical protein
MHMGRAEGRQKTLQIRIERGVPTKHLTPPSTSNHQMPAIHLLYVHHLDAAPDQ